MEGVEVTLRLAADPPGTRPIGRQERHALPESARGAPGHGRRDVEIADEGLAGGRLRREVVCRALCLLVHPQDQQGIREHELPDLRGPRQVGLIEAADLTGAERAWRDRFHQSHAVRLVGARQGHQVLHRGVRHQTTFLHTLLHERRQVAHQAQPPRHPAHAAVEAPPQVLHRHTVVFVQRPEQPSLLERGVGRVTVKQLPKDQRIDFAHLPADGADRIAVQLP
jgi:hypothetical protein